MMRRRSPFLVGPLVGLLAACTGTTGALQRDYVRPILSDLTVQTLDVVVEVAGPPVASPPSLNVPSFQPPEWSSVLRSAKSEPATREALVQALSKRLRGLGYTKVRFLHAGGDATPAPAAAPVVTPAPPVETSTAPTPSGASSVTVAPPPPAAVPPPSPGLEQAPLAQGVTLREVLDSSQADAVLVVRAVPVDAFYLFEATGETSVLDPGAGGLAASQAPVEDRITLRSGRLLVGQAFLFDRETGLRLWTRQLPDYPEEGKLRPDSKLLEYGFVTPEGSPELMPADKADKAAAAFSTAMFSTLPRAHTGSDDARAQLAALDAGAEQSKQTFLDESHFILQLDASWAAESAGLGLAIDDEPLEGLGTGAIAPSGLFRVTPRLGYQSPGGFVLTLGVPIGIAPNDFARTYHRDDLNPNDADRGNSGAAVSVGTTNTFGFEVGAGWAFLLSPQLQVRPEIGGLLDVWSLDAGPAAVVETSRIYRFGVFGGGDLVYRFSEESSWFTRAGTRARVGGASAGGAFFGIDVNLGVGIFL